MSTLIFSIREENSDVLRVLKGENTKTSDLTKITVQLLQLLLKLPSTFNDTAKF